MTNYSHRDKTEEWDFAQLLRSHANEPWMTIGGRPFAAEAAALLDSLSQRLAAAERERDIARATCKMHARDCVVTERRNAELTKHVEDRENCCRQLLDTYAARQHELEQENAELARRVAASLEFTPDEMNWRAQGMREAIAVLREYESTECETAAHLLEHRARETEGTK